jgi:hypothetical protein
LEQWESRSIWEVTKLSITKELGTSRGRFSIYIDRLIALFKDNDVNSIKTLVSAFRQDDKFKSEWNAIWHDIAMQDGGKLSLTTLGTVLGAALGGVGIAALGGAIGLPLALVLGLGGLIAGSEYDSAKRLAKTKVHLLRLPKELNERIGEAADLAGVSKNDIIVEILSKSFPDKSILNES